jgi:flagellar basal-body rod protein FlgB
VKLFDPTLGVLERSLDVRLARHEVLAGNLANADTPGFQPRDVDFAKAMARASAPAEVEAGAREIPLGVAGTGAGSGAGRGRGGAPLVRAEGSAAGLDGNGVDVDRTLASVAENALQYGAATRAVGKKLAILRYVANDGQGA